MQHTHHTWSHAIGHALHSAWIRTVVLVALILIAAVPGAALAYGPERRTFTAEDPASYVTFNSIIDNEGYGDERNFTRIKDASNLSAGGWTDDIEVENGKEYLVKMYVHNNAAANLGLIATNTRVKSLVPTTIGKELQIDGYVSADNANPAEVWDDVTLTSDREFVAQYVAGSAVFYNNIQPQNGFPLSDNIVTSSGAPVGYEAMDGNLPGCYQYAGYAVYKIRIATETISSFSAEKKVRVHGTETWSSEKITAEPGQKIDYQIGYKNTGEVTQNNVIVKDKLPGLVSYDVNTTTLRNADNSNGNGLVLTSNDVVSSGVNIGNYAAGANAFVRFTATLPTNDQLPQCGENVLRNTAYVEVGGYGRQDQIDVVVTKTCAPGTPGTTETPTALPQTGPAEVIATLVIVTVAAVVGSHFIHRHRILKEYEATLTASEHQLLLPDGHVTGADHESEFYKPDK